MLEMPTKHVCYGIGTLAAWFALELVLTGFLVTATKAEVPVPRNVTFNQMITLLCNTQEDEDVDWTFNDDPVYESQVLVVSYRERFNASKLTSKVYALTIKHVQYKDAGVYTCIERMGVGAKQSTILTVIENIEVTSTTTEAFTAKTGNQFEEQSSNTGVIVGAVLGTILGLVLLACIIFLVKHFRNRQKSNQRGPGVEEGQLLDAGNGPHPQQPRPQPNNVNGNNANNNGGVAPQVAVEKGPLHDSMQNLRDKLEFYIEFPDVITKINNTDFLNPEEVNSVVKESDNYKRTSKLLNLLLCCREEKRHQFLNILQDDDVRQSHVARFITCNGDGQQCGNDRPLDGKLLANLNVHLIVNDYSVHGLNDIVDQMHEVKHITPFQYRFIKEGENSKEKHKRLVQVLTKRSCKDFLYFTELVNERQPKLAEMLLTGVSKSSSRDRTDTCDEEPQSYAGSITDIMKALREAFEKED